MGYLKIPNLYKNQDILLFKECYALEKIHGCVSPTTKINMYDGTKKEITKINDGELILGINNDGSVVPSRVLKKFNFGKSDNWLNVVGTRFMAGRGGNGYFSIKCTDNHKFFDVEKNKYIEASDLSIGDSVFCLKSDKNITYLQKQLLLGKVLGDGTIVLNTTSGRIEWGHVIKNKEYMEWFSDGLGLLANKNTRELISGYGSIILRQQTINNYYIKDIFESFIENRKKIVPKWVAEELHPIAIAVWYMDDGSIEDSDGQRDRISIATCGFDEDSCNVLLKGLKKFGIDAKVLIYDGYRRIKINANNSEVFFSLISPYITNDMKYKIPEKFRNAGCVLPIEENKISHELTIQKITKIEKLKKGELQYDLTTETNNYFANDVLVHNTSAHIRWDNSEGEEKVILFSGGEKYDRFSQLFDIEFLKEKFKETGLLQVTIYGEAYGGSQQGMSHTYGKELKFAAFDVSIGERWLSVPEAEAFVKNFNIEFVHCWKVQTDVRYLDEVRDAHSPQAKRNGIEEPKMMEGVVLRPLVEFRNDSGRVISKHKRDEFRETRTPREVDPEKLRVLDNAKEIAEEWVVEERLGHVLNKLSSDNNGESFDQMEKVKFIIKAMIEDIKLESINEVVWSKEVEKAISNRTVFLFKKRLQERMIDNQTI